LVGLGSSGVAVAAGVMIANSCYDLKLTTQQILQQCLRIEKHPDNFTPTIVGGFTACMTSEKDDKIVYNKIPVNSKVILALFSHRVLEKFGLHFFSEEIWPKTILKRSNEYYVDKGCYRSS
jgi:homoserine kinase